MKKEDLLKDPIVSKFTFDYLPALLNGKIAINHSYDDRFLQHRNMPFEKHFIKLEDAFRAYYWPNPDDDFITNNLKLVEIQNDLINARDTKNEQEVIKAIKSVLFWGSGNRMARLYTANVDWLEGQLKSGKSAINILELARKAFSKSKFTVDNFTNQTIRSNAGFTKVYSLMMDDFIIYDSRVAAGMGLLVRKFCMHNNIDQVPDNLKFVWSSASGQDNRNPSFGNYSFPFLNNHHDFHAKSNWVANQLLSKALDHIDKNKAQWLIGSGSSLRRIEAALFMLGKDIPIIEESDNAGFQKTKLRTIDIPLNESSITADPQWIEIRTLSKNKPFFFREDEFGDVEIKYGAASVLHTFPFEIFVKIIKHFKNNGDFPTGSSIIVGERPQGSLGLWYAETSGKNVGVISYLMSYLVHKGIAEPGEQRGTLRITRDAKNKIELD